MNEKGEGKIGEEGRKQRREAVKEGKTFSP